MFGNRKDFVLRSDLLSSIDAFQAANWAEVFLSNLNIGQRKSKAAECP